MKECKNCKIEKELDCYNKSTTSISGIGSICKVCLKHINKEKNRKDREARHKRNNPTGNSSYVYIITHPKFKGWVKLGRAVDPEKRLKSYQTHCPWRAFELNYSIAVNHPRVYEMYFEENFKSNGYEWFKMSVEEAIEMVNSIKETE